MKTIHYVAILQIKRVETEDGKSPIHGVVGNSPGRKVGDVVNFTIRQGDLEKLKQNLKDHLLIVEDDVNIPLIDDKVMREAK